MRTRDWVSVGAGLAALAVAVFGAGGAFRWIQAVVVLLLAIAVAAQIPSRRVFARWSPLVLLVALALGLTMLSLVPLPSALRRLLDPVGTSFREDGAGLLDIDPWPALTRDGPGSLRAVGFFLALLATALVALRTAASERGRYRLHAGVASCCALVGIVVGVHTILGATKLYGVYELHAKPTVLGPLLNENHLGSLMTLGTCLALSLLFHTRQKTQVRALWLIVLLICGATTAASHSRGALISLLIGATTVTGLIVAQRLVPEQGKKQRSRFTTNSLPVGIVAGCVVVLVVYTSAGGVTDELSRTNLEEIHHPRSKFAAWKSAETLIRESPWTGVGRGGFETSFTRVHPASGAVTFAYLENEYLQAAVDWGIPGAILLALATLWLSGTALRRWRDGPLAAGAIGAIGAVAIQSNVDFGIELLGLAIPATIVAATVAYVPLREVAGSKLAVARGLRVALALGLLASAVLLFSNRTMSVAEDHERLDASVTEPAIMAATQRHPLDYFPYAVESERLARSNDPRSIRLLNHAMRLHPTHVALHRAAARLLLRGGHLDQAAIEYAAALLSTANPRALVSEIVRQLPGEAAVTALPVSYVDPDAVLTVLRVELHREDLAVAWLKRLVKADPRNTHACELLFDIALSTKDLGIADQAAQTCADLPLNHQTRLSLAVLGLKQHNYAAALRLIADVESWHGVVEEKQSAWIAMCDALAGLQNWNKAELCLHDLESTEPLTVERHLEVTSRIRAIDDQKPIGSTAGSAR